METKQCDRQDAHAPHGWVDPANLPTNGQFVGVPPFINCPGLLLPVEHTLDIAEVVKKLRADLLHAGYRHANAPGDLVSADGTTWISTTYTHGEYSVYAWRRPEGHGTTDESHTRVVLRITPATDPKRIDTMRRALFEWAIGPATIWPPAEMAAIR